MVEMLEQYRSGELKGYRMNIKRVSVWPESSTGKWIVSENQLGTNNEKTLGEFWIQEHAELFERALRGQLAHADLVSALSTLVSIVSELHPDAESMGGLDAAREALRKAGAL